MSREEARRRAWAWFAVTVAYTAIRITLGVLDHDTPWRIALFIVGNAAWSAVVCAWYFGRSRGHGEDT